MKFLPYEHLKIKSPLSSEEALRRLDQRIEPRRYFRFIEQFSKPYEGKIEGTRFDVSRILGCRNPLRPRIYGDVQAASQGCTIHMTMRPEVWVIVMMALFLGALGITLLTNLASAMSSSDVLGAEKQLSVLSPLVVFVLLYVFFLVSFKFESAEAKDFLQDLFDAEEVEALGLSKSVKTAG